MICQNCLKNNATVHVTEIVIPGQPSVEKKPTEASTGEKVTGEKISGEKTIGDKKASDDKTVHEQHLCEVCAQSMDLPHTGPVKKSVADIWKLLQMSQPTRKRPSQTCPSCGMTLDEFRKKGRLGCAKDYEVFAAHIGDLLERVHGARTHVGRVPGASDADLERMKRLTELRSRLDAAIREEAYESAARLRDELKALEEPRPKA